MPATAGRVRMPANNRVHSSAALQTHGIWQSAIGYDPYAPAADKGKGSKPDKDPDSNAYASFRDLLTLARITNTSTNETRGSCKKCGRIGHLTFQCRNFLSLKDDRPPAEAATAEETAKAVFEKIKKKGEIKSESEVDEDDEVEISSSDSDVDPEIERIIAERFGRPISKKAETLIKKSKKKSDSSDDDEEEERRRKRRHRHRRRCQRKSDDDSDSGHKRWRRRVRESDSDRSSDSESDRPRNQRRRRHKDRRSVLLSGSESTGSSSDDNERRERRRRKRSRGHKED